MDRTGQIHRVVFVAESILENKQRIADQIAQLRSEAVDVDNDFLNEDAMKERALDLIEMIGATLKNDDPAGFNEIVSWGSEKGKEAVIKDVPITEALQNTQYYRKALWMFIAEIVEKERLSAEDIIKVANGLDHVLDQAVFGYSKSYVEYNLQIAQRYQDTLLELSVPVVPLFSGVAVLPMIGDIDTRRAKMIQEKALERCQDLKLDRLIIDLSGVTIVDTMVAHHIFQLVTILKLLGVKAVITGIRSAVAITAVNLGIDLYNLNIYSTLQQALEALGYGLVKKETIK
ncbi:STAS domain-containing protein [Pseudalkalibacillus salsuginis]|uniref:STAS domain-containing protein n=1 Tax=Pseudalkalibacillus salsuginis TaxID=2910972 RepID=UPI001F34818B|nr:STAS domain-containing protein [Pseudalkalibacillus salsuginis]MCF6409348.1 STAS domain-containing protein [Pseudalkalibacillus salsuginis]